MPGTAIGKPIKNRYLYRYIIRLRERFGGEIVTPQGALKQGLRALRQGRFFGIVGDQSLPESPYPFDFFGRRAWTTPLPVILAHRAQCPLMVATIVRKKGRYLIHYSPPLWPRFTAPLDQEINRLMPQALALLEKSIAQYPGQWLWQHNRWKQETAKILYYRFRLDSLLIILPSKKALIHSLLPHLSTFRRLYPKAFITLLVPEKYQHAVTLPEAEVLTYSTHRDLFLRDYRFKLVFNFSSEKALKRHFLRQSAFYVLDQRALTSIARKTVSPNDSLSSILKKALSRPHVIWGDHAC